MGKKRRITVRKRIIQEIHVNEFNRRPVLLNQFRWKAFEEEMKQKRQDTEYMSRSFRNSFNRTLEHGCGNISTHHVRDPVQSLPIGLLAKVAVYRLREQAVLHEIPKGQGVQFDFFHETLQLKRTNTRYWWVTCLVRMNIGGDLSDIKTKQTYISFPYTRSIVFVGTAAPTRVAMREMAKVPWDIRVVMGAAKSVKVMGGENLVPIEMKYERGISGHIILEDGTTIDRKGTGRMVVRQEYFF